MNPRTNLKIRCDSKDKGESPGPEASCATALGSGDSCGVVTQGQALLPCGVQGLLVTWLFDPS